MTLKTYYPRTIAENALEELKNHLDPEIEVITGTDIPSPADYEILVAGRPTKEQLEASPKLHSLIIPWAGLAVEASTIMVDYPEINIHNLHHNAVATGETAMMLMYTAAKQIIPIDQIFRNNDWRPRYQPNPARLLHGKNILILGFGSIGQYIGGVCHAMGMTVDAIRRNASKESSFDYPVNVYPPEDLHKLLPKSEVLMITVPLTEETRGLIGVKEIDLLPKNSILINVGRALVVDPEALYNALKSKKLHSAGIDVWYNYPPDEESRANTPPADFPFHELENIVMSPHRGGGAVEIEQLRMKHLAALLNTASKGEVMQNKVDLTRGY
ncbi:MAG: hypothetical protein HON98_04555 [Chloroflexi bacterium]|jgi:phosphoglycerate dehydrogenase-like enzyme|nr:hypothetical protein [Chloroflexota bacterium]MBT3671191.1 hypothetical protein [Chloroflexota bacterium]MBT4002527.1 hypothetical protein [Chloroflexota bacterium]MBT4304350.1 hypothetical protein [Chloroflexota bacterium]MBT4534369.1 hypothetical protein [Chloroflexota bacterium]